MFGYAFKHVCFYRVAEFKIWLLLPNKLQQRVHRQKCTSSSFLSHFYSCEILQVYDDLPPRTQPRERKTFIARIFVFSTVKRFGWSSMCSGWKRNRKFLMKCTQTWTEKCPTLRCLFYSKQFKLLLMGLFMRRTPQVIYYTSGNDMC